MPSERLGPYEIETTLGRGGMGTVYRVRLLERRHGLEAGARVALKVVHANLLASGTFRERFDREARIGVRVAHPNVVRAYGQDVVETPDGPQRALVMEYVEGQTLRALMREVGRVSEALGRAIARSLAEGLGAIHAAGAVHRDLKPENVLITPDNLVKIMDLGVAHVQDEVIRLTQVDAFAGSVEYAAPEQFPGSKEPPDGRSDLFSLGVVLYEMVSGEHPFRADDARRVLGRILREEPRKAGELNPQVSPFFEEVLATLLAKSPAARFASADALLDVLDGGEAGAWWAQRAHDLRRSIKRPLRRVHVPHETPVFGREDELSLLRRTWQRAREGNGQVVLLRGEAGIGKTRLVDEFVRRLAQDGETPGFLVGAYPPRSVATVHGAFSAAFREYLGAEDLDATLRELFGADWFLLPGLVALLLGSPLPPGASPLTRETLHLAFASVTRKLSADRPLVLFVDDLHNAPEEGRALFSALGHAIRDQRVLLVGGGRPRLPAAWVADLSALPHVQRLELERLDPAALRRLLQSALGAPGLVRDLEPTIALKSDGNPFFVLEILRSLRDRRQIQRRPDGSWTATGRTEVVEIPSSLHDLIRYRLSEVDRFERELLDVGACCGFEFDPLLVAEVAGAERIPALRALGRIEAEHRLVRSQGRSYVFDHHQLMEVLYAELSPLLREEIHGTIARVLEGRLTSAAPSDVSGPVAVDVCRHDLKGAKPRCAARYLETALDHLEEGHQIQQAIELMEEAAARSGLLDDERLFGVLMRLNHAFELQGRRDEQSRILEDARRRADEAADETLRLQVELARAHLEFNRARLDDARRCFETSRVSARRLEDRRREARAEGGLGLVAYRQGRLEDARRHFERNHDLSEQLGDHSAALSSLGNLGVTLQALGRLEDALACLQRVLSTAKEMGSLRIEGKSCDNLGILLQNLGRVGEAQKYYARAVEIADRTGDRLSQAVGRLNLGSLLRDQDRLAEAGAAVAEALEIGREIGDPVNQAICLDNLGVIALTLGDPAGAREKLEEALALCREVGSRRDEGYVLENLGRLAEDEGRLDDAEAAYRQSLQLRSAIPYPLGAASATACLARVAAARGDVDRARGLLEDAIRIGIEHHAPGVLLRARVLRAVLPGGPIDDGIEALAIYGNQVDREDVLRANHLLWKATGDPRYLREARRLLDERIRHAPSFRRAAMRERVPLHREILAAGDEARAPRKLRAQSCTVFPATILRICLMRRRISAGFIARAR